MSTTVLLADREPLTHGFLERHLRFDGFEIVAPSGAPPDLVIAAHDAELERWCGEAPVIVLGSHEPAPDEPVRAFRRGCDDYLARPFRYDELVERIRAVLRRSGAAGRRFLVAGPLRVDLEARLATVRAQPLPLSKKEYALIVRLAADPQRVFTREELLRDVFGYRSSVRTRTLDSHVSRLRRKLRRLDPETSYLENEWGIGYRLVGLHPPG
jgi:DNA-binding response OmpR family regulator